MIGGSNFYTQEELESIGFKSIGTNVKISKLAQLYKHELISIGNNVRIEDFCILNGEITLGDNVTICSFSLLDGYAGIELNEDVTLATRVSIHSGSDDYSGRSLFGTYVPSKYRLFHKRGKVVVRSHTLIGDSSIIMPCLTLGEGTAIGANSFVKNSTEPWGIYCGIPAKRIKDRSKDLLPQWGLFKDGRLDDLYAMIRTSENI